MPGPAWPIMDLSLLEIAIISAALMLGGFVKGVTGSGLPLTSAPIIALITNVPAAVTLVTLPSLVTNIWQAAPVLTGRYSMKPFYAIFGVVFVGTVIGVFILKNADTKTLLLALGIIVLIGALFLIAKPNFKLPKHLHDIGGILSAAIGGVVGGMSGQAGVVLVPYFVTLRLRPDRYIVTISVTYLFILIPLTVLLVVLKVVPLQMFLASFVALIPSLIGVRIGQVYRSRINPVRFRLFVLIILVAGAIAMIWKSLGS